jgi:hypothetical protein
MHIMKLIIMQSFASFSYFLSLSLSLRPKYNILLSILFGGRIKVL